jgi:hypothetical protein
MAMNPLFVSKSMDILSSLSIASARPQFELAFNQLQNSVIKRINDKIQSLQDDSKKNASLNINLQRELTKLERMTPVVNAYTQEVIGARANVQQIQDKLYDMEAAATGGDAATFNSLKAFVDDQTLRIISPNGSGINIFSDDNIPAFRDDGLGISAFTATPETGAIRLQATLGADPVSTTSGSTTVTVTQGLHQARVGDYVTLSGITDTGGIPAADLNKQHLITSVSGSSFTVVVATAATSSADGGGAAVDAAHRSTPYNQVLRALANVDDLDTRLLNRQEDAAAMYESYNSQLAAVKLQIQSNDALKMAEQMAEIKKLKDHYGEMLNAISLAFEVQASANEQMTKQLQGMGKPEPGTIIDMFS